MLRLVAIALLVITLGAPGPALAVAPLTRACQAPPLPPPAGAVVEVTTEAELQAAVASLASGTTVLLRPGVYVLTSTLWLDGDVDHVAIRGSTDSCDDAVLVGRGMANADFGGVPHGIWIGNARHVLVANLTIRDVYYHPVQLDPAAGAHAPRVYNVRMVDAGEQFVKSSAARRAARASPTASSSTPSWNTPRRRAPTTRTASTCTREPTGLSGTIFSATSGRRRGSSPARRSSCGTAV